MQSPVWASSHWCKNVAYLLRYTGKWTRKMDFHKHDHFHSVCILTDESVFLDICLGTESLLPEIYIRFHMFNRIFQYNFFFETAISALPYHMSKWKKIMAIAHSSMILNICDVTLNIHNKKLNLPQLWQSRFSNLCVGCHSSLYWLMAPMGSGMYVCPWQLCQ